MSNQSRFLPMSQEELSLLGWDSCDFIIVTGDAYVDHCSFGAAVIGRLLESKGFRVGIIAQPDVDNLDSFKQLGRPKLAFLVTSGNLDSMVSNYSVNKRRRDQDAYSPVGKMAKRPDRAVIAYSSKVKGAYKGVGVILGGIEASLRRLTHYDYWGNKIRHSILQDSKADILVYGMGEHAIVEIAKRLKEGEAIGEIDDVRGTVSFLFDKTRLDDAICLPCFESQKEEKRTFADAFKIQYENTDPYNASTLVEPILGNRYLIQNKPSFPLTTQELDAIYELPYCRSWHPCYNEVGGIAAFNEVKFSLVSSRGCFGGCSFCAITFHQGKQIAVRSHDSLVREAKILTRMKDFKGIIHDLGGPTANFRKPSCKKQAQKGSCIDKSCLGMIACQALSVDHVDYLQLLRKIRNIEGVKKVFIRSGIRYDYLLMDCDDSFFKELVEHHVSGQLKVAPEHASNKVLRLMDKPPIKVYENFKEKFFKETKKLGKKQFVIPYLISSHPGSGLNEAIELALFLKRSHFIPDQVQDFYPTPGTLSTAMFYCDFHPLTGEKVWSAKQPHEKKMQRALLHFHKPENYLLVKKALLKAGRSDLIGSGAQCLIKTHLNSL